MVAVRALSDVLYVMVFTLYFVLFQVAQIEALCAAGALLAEFLVKRQD